MTSEPTRSPPAWNPGTWGFAGISKTEMPIDYCVPGPILIQLFPELAGDKKYLRGNPGRLWSVCKRKGRHTLLRLALNHWNPENPRTCESCREIFNRMQRVEEIAETKGRTAKV